MKVLTIPYKPLVIFEVNKEVFIGDAGGNIITLSTPFSFPRIFQVVSAPVSALCFYEKLFYGTWDGVVGAKEKTVKLGTNMIKAMIYYHKHVYVSVDKKLVVIDLDLNIVEEHTVPHKIYCMCLYQDKVFLGLGSGFSGYYKDQEIKIYKTEHESTILSIKDNITGSTNGCVRIVDHLIKRFEGWIRSIFSSSLFSSGKHLIQNNELLYSHDDEITGVIQLENTIISIGLDCVIKIFGDNLMFDSKEEEELLALLNEE